MNAMIAWMTEYLTMEYLGLAAERLRAQERRGDEELLAHFSPAQSQNSGLFGTITVDVDIDAELAQLDLTGHRPLRLPAAADEALCPVVVSAQADTEDPRPPHDH